MYWKKIELEDIKVIDEITKGRFKTGDMSAVNIFIWRKGKDLEFSTDRGALTIRGREGETDFFYPPVSDSLEAVRDITEELLREGYLLRGVPESMHGVFTPLCGLSEERDRFDYVYRVRDLIDLKGRRYHKKKNHLNKFIKSYDYTYESIDNKNIHEVISYMKEWCRDRECHLDKGLSDEHYGIVEVLEAYESLPLRGGALRIDGSIAAFTLGEVLTEDMVLIHVEKGSFEYSGIYQAMNKLFLEEEFSDYTFVNREEDLGSETMRKAKESYHPWELLKKYQSVS